MSTDTLEVAFPASEAFVRIGRVTVVGLALRLGIDVGRVELIRSAVDRSVKALQGSGQIHTVAKWDSDQLVITLRNPDARIVDAETLAGELNEQVSQATIEDTSIHLAVLI